MAYQFGTRRLATNPLKELLKEQDARRAREENRATQLLRQFPFRDVYQGADGNYYENRTDNQGNYYPESQISKAQFDAYTQQNAINNRARTELGLNPVQTSPAPTPEADSGGFIQGLKTFGKNFASKFGKNKETLASTPPSSPDAKPTVVQAKPTGKLQTIDDGQKTAQKNQIANPNITGTNVDITKQPSTGGAVKQSLFDDKIGETSPVVDPRTEDAYNRSLSMKGKPMPNVPRSKEAPKAMTDQDYANVRKTQRSRVDDLIKQRIEKKKAMSPTEAYEDAVDKRDQSRSKFKLPLKDMTSENMATERKLMNYKLMRDSLRPEVELLGDVPYEPMTFDHLQAPISEDDKITILPMERKGKLKDSKGNQIPNVQYAGKQRKKKDNISRFGSYKTKGYIDFMKGLKEAIKKGDKKATEWMNKFLDYQQTRIRP
tara:strand:- start:6364 stop:7659 length:1296 start_codon:yes stop_codon:yes gene_type:complete